MRTFLFVLLLTCHLYAEPHQLYDWHINRVVDGDTVEVHVDFLPKELGEKLLIRVWGVDTPEKGWRAKSEKESQMGFEATEFTKKEVTNAKNIKINVIGWDKYGGRILGDVILDGQSLRELLLKNGYAREYYGDKKQDW